MAVPKNKRDNALLKNLVPLNTLSEEQLSHLMSRIVVEKAKKGEFLFREGDTDHQNIYLLSGAVSLLSGQREMDVVSSGTQMARFALAHQLPRKNSAKAKSAVSYVRIDSRMLSDLLARSQSASYEVNESGSSSKSDWMSLLLQLPVFQQIPPANLQWVMMRMEEITVSADDVIIQQGDEGDYFYLISRGVCRVTRQPAADRPPVELAQLKAGQGFGEEAMISDKPRSSTVTMLTEGDLVRLSKKDFVELVKQPLSQPIDYSEACKMAQDNALWIDVRTPEEYEAGHLAGAINLPFYSLRFQASSLASDRTYLIYGTDADQSTTVAYLLVERGYEVMVLSNGWKELSAQAVVEAPGLEPPVDNVIDFNRDMDVSPEERAAQDEGRKENAGKKLRHELAEKKQAYEQKITQYQSEIKLLKQALGVAKRKLEQQEHAAKEAQDSLSQEVAQLRAALATMEESAHEREALAASEQKLKEQVDNLQMKLAELEQALQQSQDEGAASEASLNTTLAEANERAERLQNELQSVSDATAIAVANNQQQISDLLSKLEQMGQTENEQATSLQQEQQANDELKQKLEETKAELKRLDARRIELEELFEQEHQAVGFLKRSLETAEVAVEIADDTGSEYREEIVTINQQLATQQSERERLEEAKAKLEQRLVEAQNNLEAQLHSAEEMERIQRASIEQLKAELSSARIELEQSKLAQSAAQATGQALEDARQEISELTRMIDGLREVQLEMESQISNDLEEEIQRLRDVLKNEERKRRNAEELAKQTDVLRREREVQESAVEILGEDLEDLGRENTQLVAQKEALTRQFEELRGQLQDATSIGASDELAALRAELDLVRRQASEDLEQLRKQLADTQSRTRGHSDRDASEVASLQALRQEIDSSQKAQSEKEHLLSQSQAQCRTLEDEIEDRDKEVDQLRHKLELLLRKTVAQGELSELLNSDILADSQGLFDDSQNLSKVLREDSEAKRGNKLGRLFRK
jgi:CRP-like cAMP-binding protein